MADYDIPGFGREIEPEQPKPVVQPKAPPEMTPDGLVARVHGEVIRSYLLLGTYGDLMCERDRRRPLGLQILEKLVWQTSNSKDDRAYFDQCDKQVKRGMGDALEAMIQGAARPGVLGGVEESRNWIREQGGFQRIAWQYTRAKRQRDQDIKRQRDQDSRRGRELLEEWERREREQATPTATPSTSAPAKQPERTGELLPKLPLPPHLQKE